MSIWAPSVGPSMGGGSSYHHAHPGLLQGQEAAVWHRGSKRGAEAGCPVGKGVGEPQGGRARPHSCSSPRMGGADLVLGLGLQVCLGPISTLWSEVPGLGALRLKLLLTAASGPYTGCSGLCKHVEPARSQGVSLIQL